jgi:hypothetical protein
MNNEHDPIEMRPTNEPTFEEKRAIAASNAAIAMHYDGDVVDRRAAALKEEARSRVDDDVKTFSPEVIARLIRKREPIA